MGGGARAEARDRRTALPTGDHPPSAILMGGCARGSQGPGDALPTGDHPPEAILMGEARARKPGDRRTALPTGDHPPEAILMGGGARAEARGASDGGYSHVCTS